LDSGAGQGADSTERRGEKRGSAARIALETQKEMTGDAGGWKMNGVFAREMQEMMRLSRV
jgi:hypothetical protein